MKPRLAVVVFSALLSLSARQASAVNTVFSQDIVNGEVKNADLAINAVGSENIQNGQVENIDLGAGAVTSDKILDLSVGTVDLADGAINSGKLAADAVTSATILDGAIGSNDLADGAVTAGKINRAGLDADLLDGIDSTGFAPISHFHQQSDVTGFDTALAGKASASHTHDADYRQKVANVIVVAKSGGDFTDPVAAVASITDASPSNPYIVKMAPGVYDIGSQTITVPYSVDVVGAGENATFIVGNGTAVVQIFTGNVEIRSLSVENTGNPSYDSWAIYVSGSFPVRIADVTAKARPGYGQDDAFGIGLYDVIAALKDVTVECESGVGIIADPRNGVDPAITLDNVQVTVVNGGGIQAGSPIGGGVTLINNARVRADICGIGVLGRVSLTNSDIEGGLSGVVVGDYGDASIAHSRLKGQTCLQHGHSSNMASTKLSFSECDGTLTVWDTRLSCFQVHDGNLNSVTCP